MAPPGGQQAAMPEMPKMPNMWPLLITMILIFALYGLDQWNFDGAKIFADGKAHNIGQYLNYVFGPIVGFDGQFPVLTLMLAGTVMVLLSSILRTLLTDTLAQQKATAYSSAFNKELREARIANNMYKVKKLQEMQPEVMAKSMETSGAMMKIMPWTMLIVVPMFLWVRFFVGDTLTSHETLVISVPWCSYLFNSGIGVDLSQSYVFPAWILVYSLVSIPIGQAVTRVVRYYQFKKKLAELDAQAGIVDVSYTTTPAAEQTSVPAQPTEVPKEEPPVAEQPQDKQEPPKEGL